MEFVKSYHLKDLFRNVPNAVMSARRGCFCGGELWFVAVMYATLNPKDFEKAYEGTFRLSNNRKQFYQPSSESDGLLYVLVSIVE